QVLYAAPAMAHAVQHLHHPAGPFAAGGTLAARFMGKKTARIVQHIDDTGLVIEDNYRRRAQSQAARLHRAAEVERGIEFLLRQKPHAEPAGNAALGLTALPDATSVLIDQFPHGNSQRELHAAGLVDVPADAEKLGAVAACIPRVP